MISLKTRHRISPIYGFLILAVFFLVLSGCATPVGVRYLDLRQAARDLNASILSGDSPSPYTTQILNRANLAGRFRAQPEEVLAELHRAIPTATEEDRLFALSELSYTYASRGGPKRYFLASAVYAYAFLYPKEGRNPPDGSDPRVRIAMDLYNMSLPQALTTDDGLRVEITSGSHELPFGRMEVSVDRDDFRWGSFELTEFIQTAQLSVRGLRNDYRWPGIGAPLVASLKEMEGVAIPAYSRIPPALRLPVTLFLRIDKVEDVIRTGKATGRFELYTTGKATTVTIGNRVVPLEYDLTPALAYTLEGSKSYGFELKGLFSGEYSVIKGRARVEDGIFLMAPYRPGRIPVVFIHGTASSPARWAEMFNELQNDRNLWGHYQFWLFTYNTGNPILYSGGILIEGLKSVTREFDPEGKDPAMKKMVIIGHSQGGLLTKLTAVDSGNAFWANVTSTPFNEINVLPETKKLLKGSLFYERLPFVKRVVFISTPQKGSYVAGGWIGKLAGKMISLPGHLLNPLQEVLAHDPQAAARFSIKNIPKSTDNMDPKNPFIKAISSLSIAQGIYAHSIIPVANPDAPKEKWTDGVVKYESAHIEGVASELIIKNSGHSAQDTPEAIEEVRRILIENLKEP